MSKEWKAIADCDVRDKGNLNGYWKFYKKLYECVKGDIVDPKGEGWRLKKGSFLFEYQTLLQTHYIYKSYCNVVKMQKVVNPFVYYFMFNGYFTIQIMTIRRLTESGGDLHDKEKGVKSLLHVMRYIKNINNLITRENFVSFDGCPYSPDEIGTIEYGNGGGDPSPHLGYAIGRHERFDKLMGLEDISKRNRKDKIPVEKWDELIQKFGDENGKNKDFVFHKKWEILRDYSSKYIAHSATEDSKESFLKTLNKENNDHEIPLGTIEDFLKIFREYLEVFNLMLGVPVNRGFDLSHVMEGYEYSITSEEIKNNVQEELQKELDQYFPNIS